MAEITYVIKGFLALFIDALLLGMLLRAIMSFITFGEETPFTNFLFVITEPVILPIRLLCDRFGWFEGIPFDMPFFITQILLLIASFLLEKLI